MSRQLIELLHQERLITQSQLHEAENIFAQGGDAIRVFVSRKAVSESKIVYFLSQRFALQSINLSKFNAKTDVTSMISAELAKKAQAIPIQKSSGSLVVAMVDPTLAPVLEEIKQATKLNVESVLTTFSSFDEAFEKYYGIKFSEVSARGGGGIPEANLVSAKLNANSEVTTAVQAILLQAAKHAGSVSNVLHGTLHFEPTENELKVRLRVAHGWVEIATISSEMKRAVTAYLKKEAGIAEGLKIPQEGKFSKKWSGKNTEYGVVTVPTVFGDKICIEPLPEVGPPKAINDLDILSEQKLQIRSWIDSRSGLLVLLGANSNSIREVYYSVLFEAARKNGVAMSLEKKVASMIPGATQVEMGLSAELSAADWLRAVASHGNDYLFIKEVFDSESQVLAARIAASGTPVCISVVATSLQQWKKKLFELGVSEAELASVRLEIVSLLSRGGANA